MGGPGLEPGPPACKSAPLKPTTGDDRHEPPANGTRLYKAVGMAQMDAKNRCSAAVTKHQLYGVLRSFKRRDRWAMAGRFNGNGKPGRTIRVAVRYKCRSRHLRGLGGPRRRVVAAERRLVRRER